MSTTTKILIGIALLALILFLGFLSFNEKAPGMIIGGIAAIWAAIKGNLFGASGTEIRREHREKRQEWQSLRDEYDSRFQALQARMDYLDYRNLTLKAQLNDLDVAEVEKLKEIRRLSDEEMVDYFNDLLRRRR
jgi:hypothetical protein